MRTTQEEIDIEVDLIRGTGYYGELHVVPVIDMRCFVYCGHGRCNCSATVKGKYCIVTDDKLKEAQQNFLSELESLEKMINKT